MVTRKISRTHDQPRNAGDVFNGYAAASPPQPDDERQQHTAPVSPNSPVFRRRFSTVREPQHRIGLASDRSDFCSSSSALSASSVKVSQADRPRRHTENDTDLHVPLPGKEEHHGMPFERVSQGLGTTAPASLGGEYGSDYCRQRDPITRGGCSASGGGRGCRKSWTGQEAGDDVDAGVASNLELGGMIEGGRRRCLRRTLRCWRSVESGDVHVVGRWEDEDDNVVKGRRHQQDKDTDNGQENREDGDRLYPSRRGCGGDSGTAAGQQDEDPLIRRRRGKPEGGNDIRLSCTGQCLDDDAIAERSSAALYSTHAASAADGPRSLFSTSPSRRRRRASSPNLGNRSGNNADGYVPSWAERTSDGGVQRHCHDDGSVIVDRGRAERCGFGEPTERATNGRERSSSPTPDPRLLSTLKRGGSRNARCSREERGPESCNVA